MYIVLLVIIVIICVCLGFIVLIQNPKGGGLSSNFSSSSQLMGVQKTGDFLEKGTWVLAISLMVLSLAINVMVKSGTAKASATQLSEQNKKASAPTNQSGAASQSPFGGTAQPASQQPTTPAPVKK
jgi:preprotein translocase subunit SecG